MQPELTQKAEKTWYIIDISIINRTLHDRLNKRIIFSHVVEYSSKSYIRFSSLLKTGCNNVMAAILFMVVNNIIVEPESGVTMLNNIVDNFEQCCPTTVFNSF